MHVALRKNSLRDHGNALRLGKKRAHLRLHVGRKSGVGEGGEFERFRRAVAGDGDVLLVNFDRVARLCQSFRDTREMARIDAL